MVNYRTIMSNIKIADFSWNAAAPMGTKFLADCGATVIHIESHTRLDLLRMISPFKEGKPGYNRSGFFSRYESSKYGVTLDLNNKGSEEVCERIIKWADILVENFLPGKMKKWDLDYEKVSQINPGIIYLSSSQQGQTGPFATYAGFGGLSTALSGFYSITGMQGGEPVLPYAAYTDFATPPFLVAVVMAALDYRRRTGEGVYIDLAQSEGGMQYLAPLLMDYSVNGRIRSTNGNKYEYACPHGVYPCSGEDKWAAIAIHNEEQWKRLCTVIGRQELIKRADYASIERRKEKEDELDKILAEWTKRQTGQQVMKLLQEAHVPCGLVANNEELFADLQLQHREHFVWKENKEMGIHVHEKPPFRFSELPIDVRTAPMLGEHNDYVYKEILKYSDEEVALLCKRGIITSEKDLAGYRASL